MFQPTFECLEFRIVPARPHITLIQPPTVPGSEAVIRIQSPFLFRRLYVLNENGDDLMNESAARAIAQGKTFSPALAQPGRGELFLLDTPKTGKGVLVRIPVDQAGTATLRLHGAGNYGYFTQFLTLHVSAPTPPVLAPSVPPAQPVAPPSPHPLSADGLFYRVETPGSGQELARVSVGIGPATFDRLVLALGTGNWHDVANVALRVYGSLPSDPTLGSTYAVNALGDTLTISGIGYTIPANAQQFSVLVDAGIGGVPLQLSGVSASSA